MLKKAVVKMEIYLLTLYLKIVNVCMRGALIKMEIYLYIYILRGALIKMEIYPVAFAPFQKFPRGQHLKMMVSHLVVRYHHQAHPPCVCVCVCVCVRERERERERVVVVCV
jgi:hypothetical protein